ncbi:MAG: hypothetical protein AB8E82_11805 [Aureispira sp.]
MTYILLALYLLVFGFWLRRTPSVEHLDLSRRFLFSIFLFKLLMGGAYLLIYKYYFVDGDTFAYLQESTLIGQSFWEYPSYYFANIFGVGASPPEGATVFLYPPAHLFWKDLGTYILVHFHALLYPFTNGLYGVHLFFIGLLGWLASLNFYHIFKKVLYLPKQLLLICCFFLPSLSFWTAGMHKDVYVYYGLSLFCLGLLRWQQQENKVWQPLISGVLVIGLTRYYLLALLLPAAVAYLITLRQKRVFISYALVYLASLVIALISCELLLGKSVFELLSQRQLAFLAEKGGSSIIDVIPFEPTLGGVLSALPAAIFNIIGRPFLWECKDILQLVASLEMISFMVLLTFSLSYRKTATTNIHPLVYFLLAYTISNLLLVGLLVYNIGTLVRYRAIGLGILSTLLMHLLDVPARFQPPKNTIPPTPTPPLSSVRPSRSSQKKANLVP